jgi:threonine/homoserine/homoserine lactone efflux protein
MEYILAFIIALVLNFVGMIIPGMITLKIVSVQHKKGFQDALLFALGVAFVEFFQTIATLRFSSLFADFFKSHTEIKWIVVIVLSVLAFSLFFSKPNKPNSLEVESEEDNYRKTSFIKGMFLSLFNLLKYPFWIFQGVYFLNSGILKTDMFSIVFFSTGATIGAFAMYFIYIKLGQVLLEKFDVLAKNLNRVLAIFLIFLAIIQLINIYY